MKHLSFKYDDTKKYNKAIKEAQSSKYSAKLIQLFISTTKKKEIQKVLNRLAKDFPDTLVIGATTAGEISHAKMYDKETIISLSLFKTTKLKAHKIKKIDKSSGLILSNKICSKHTKAAIILSEGLQGKDYENFIKGVKKENPQVILAGGLAGDNFELKQTYVFMGTKIFKEGAVGVSFSGEKLFARNDYNLNWNPIGKEFTVTASQGNLLLEMDSQNAIKLFKRYLGKNIFKNNSASLPDFPLLYKEGNTIVSRTPMTTDGNAIVLAGPIKEGQVVQFGFSNASSIISGSEDITQKLSHNPAEAIYIYSCIARKTLLGKKLESEFKPFEQIAPTAGFFTYGEFYSTDIDNALLNCTTTILVLSEASSSKKVIKVKREASNDLDNITFNALTHFIKQTSHELHENTKLLGEYKDVVDESSLISKTDLKGKIIYVNDTFCKISKYKREELIGQKHNIVRDPNMSEFIFKKLWFTILRGRIWKGLISNRAKDGTVYYVDATIMPIFDEKGEVKEFIAIRQDVTKQIESKRRIQEKEKLIKAIFDNQDSIVIYASKVRGMLNVNKKLFETLNYTSFEEFKDKNKCICDLFLEEDGYIYPAKYPNWLDDVSGKLSGSDTKVKMYIKDGTIHTFNLMIKRINDEYIINLYDISRLEEAIFKAHASEQAKSTFLANMSHEIRTPLNGILGFTDVLTKKDLDKDSMRYIDIIHKSGQTLLNVVNDILDFSKIESGELSLFETEANLFKEMEAAVSTFSSISKTKQINYYVYIDTSIPKILTCDAQRIKQVLNNLISNAIKFTPNDGEVTVEIVLKSIINNKAKIHFSVQDSGIGIEKKKQKTVFQAFSQADDSISREFGGTGLGLAISNQYVKMMNSEIQLKSQKGEGSQFYFDLELDIVDNSISIEQNNQELNICVLHLKDEINCAINKIIFSYLDAWKYNYKEINSIDEVDDNSDLVIVCAKLFDKESCESALNNHSKLQLIYVEGLDNNFNCTHPKFHLVEQPMTGSALFDKIMNSTQILSSKLSQKEQVQEDTHQYNGTVLVAEDNETNQMLISLMLEERGIDFKIVNNGQEAVDEALASNYDLIFMDINMPVLDGVSATKELRKQEYTGAIVSLSANVIETDIISFKEAGINSSLNKPIVPKELDTTLMQYLGLPKSKKSYDIVDIDKISKALLITNRDVILKLLKSFASSLEEILKTLQTTNINKDITHNLKGMAGNLRFMKIHDLVNEYDKTIDHWDEEKHQKNKQELIAYLESVIEQTKLLK